jgi:hypothetical protein
LVDFLVDGNDAEYLFHLKSMSWVRNKLIMFIFSYCSGLSQNNGKLVQRNSVN